MSPMAVGARPELEFDVEIAEAVGRSLELWGRLAKALGEPAVSQYADQVHLLNLRFARGVKVSTLAWRLGTSVRTVQRRLDAACFSLWTLRGV